MRACVSGGARLAKSKMKSKGWGGKRGVKVIVHKLAVNCAS